MHLLTFLFVLNYYLSDKSLFFGGNTTLANEFESRMTKCFSNWKRLNGNWRSLHYKTVDEENSEKQMIDEILKSTLGEGILQFRLRNDPQSKPVLTMTDFIMNTYRNVPYHNVCHGIVVSHYSFKMLVNEDAEELSDQAKTVMLAGLFHDIGHPGYGNGHCSKADSQAYLAPGRDLIPFCSLSLKEEGGCAYNADLDFESYFGLFDSKEDLVGLVDSIKKSFLSSVKFFRAPKHLENSQPSDSPIFSGEWDKIYCVSEELQHSLITNRLLTKYYQFKYQDNPIPEEIKLLIWHVTLGILYTHMHNFFDPYIKTVLKDEFKFLEAVHLSDVSGLGEFESEDFSIAMQKGVHKEFIQEGKVFNVQSILNNYSSEQNFINSQDFFINKVISEFNHNLHQESPFVQPFLQNTIQKLKSVQLLLKKETNDSKYPLITKDALKEFQEYNHKIFV